MPDSEFGLRHRLDLAERVYRGAAESLRRCCVLEGLKAWGLRAGTVRMCENYAGACSRRRDAKTTHLLGPLPGGRGGDSVHSPRERERQ